MSIQDFVLAGGWEVLHSSTPLLLIDDRIHVTARDATIADVAIKREGKKVAQGVGRLSDDQLLADFQFAVLILLRNGENLSFKVRPMAGGDHPEGGGSSGPPTGGQ